MCVERERESVCVCVCLCVNERIREGSKGSRWRTMDGPFCTSRVFPSWSTSDPLHHQTLGRMPATVHTCTHRETDTHSEREGKRERDLLHCVPHEHIHTQVSNKLLFPYQIIYIIMSLLSILKRPMTSSNGSILYSTMGPLYYGQHWRRRKCSY